MSRNQITNISDDSDVIQHLAWDTSTKMIEIVHMINLVAGRDVIWTRVTQQFNEAEKKYYTTYYYTEIENKQINYDRAVKFPTNGSYYPASNLPHVVIVNFARVEGGGVSSTQGEAIPS